MQYKLAENVLYTLFTLQMIEVVPTRGENKTGQIDEWWKQVSTGYPRYESTTQLLEKMQSAFPEVFKIYTVGKSVEGREMWVINMRTNIQEKRKLLQPPMKIVANMHGDETLGRSLLLMLTVDILKRYENKDPNVTQLLNTTDIHLMPSVNPDGFEASRELCSPDPTKTGRRNANQVDLNRNFPDQFNVEKEDDIDLFGNREPETLNMMKYISTNDFVLSANFHGGAIVASYPYDSLPGRGGGRGVKSLSPDNQLFVYLAKLYASNHKTMANDKDQCEGEKFVDGITNGAHWYNVAGGMQDFNYVHSNCFEITVELSCCKHPNSSTLRTEWDYNVNSLYRYIEATHMGIRGIVKDTRGKPIEGAEIIVEGIDHPIRTTKRGEYWRLLLPGHYRVSAKALRFKVSDKVDIDVGLMMLDKPTILDFNLTDAPLPANDGLSRFASTVCSLYIFATIVFQRFSFCLSMSIK